MKEGLDIAPLSASIKNPRNRLPIYGLANDDIFCGLPAFIADSLPGRWGNTVFDAWAAERQDVIERHFAEMSPDLLSGLHGYKPHVFSFMLGDI